MTNTKKPREDYQIIIKSRPGDQPSDFEANLLNQIPLNPHKRYSISLKNAILSASWPTNPKGVAYTVDGVEKIIPDGHFTFDTLADYIKTDMTLLALPYAGKCKVTSVGTKVVILKSLAPLLGFPVDTLVNGSVGASKVSISPFTFLSVSCSLVDINSTRSNYNVRPILRTSLIPDCLEAYQIFDLCSAESGDYAVKLSPGQIGQFSLRIADENGNPVPLDNDIPTFFTILIKELDNLDSFVK